MYMLSRFETLDTTFATLGSTVRGVGGGARRGVKGGRRGGGGRWRGRVERGHEGMVMYMPRRLTQHDNM